MVSGSGSHADFCCTTVWADRLPMQPSVTQARAYHVCVPLRQLSMLFLRLNDVILFPHTPTDAELATMMSQKLDRSSRFMLERLLTDQQLSQLWSSEAVLTLLRDTCLLCGDKLGAADLHLHLYEAHKCGTPLVKFYIQQLLPYFMQVTSDSHRCHACQQVFSDPNLTADIAPNPAREVEAQTHFRAQCPCILQAAILLAKAAHGRHGHGNVRGGWRTDPSGLSTFVPDVGHQPEAVAEWTTQARKEKEASHREITRHPTTTWETKSKVNLASAMTLMAKLAIQLDREMQLMKKEDTYIFFFANKENEGSLPLLVQTTETWGSGDQSSPGENTITAVANR